MTTQTFTVTGMTCQHCVASVTKEISAIEGVNTVEVNLEKGAVTVERSSDIDTQDVKAAVERAGYTLTS